jgi:hypothetical protein
MHTVPVDAPCAGGEFTTPNKTVPISIKIDAETIIFFKNYARILGLLEKAVSLRLVAVAIFQWTNPISAYSQSSPEFAQDSFSPRLV